MLFGKLTQGYVTSAFHQAPVHVFVSICFMTSKHSSVRDAGSFCLPPEQTNLRGITVELLHDLGQAEMGWQHFLLQIVLPSKQQREELRRAVTAVSRLDEGFRAETETCTKKLSVALSKARGVSALQDEWPARPGLTSLLLTAGDTSSFSY